MPTMKMSLHDRSANNPPDRVSTFLVGTACAPEREMLVLVSPEGLEQGFDRRSSRPN
ncbi:hypothetical protein ACLQ3B_24375 [Micromonospora sp. DT53]|uniref:hypothetical protein n=1 Tax=Micromonospora sp. DT53 TaxID=3393444 RepID=UPI003CEED468